MDSVWESFTQVGQALSSGVVVFGISVPLTRRLAGSACQYSSKHSSKLVTHAIVHFPCFWAATSRCARSGGHQDGGRASALHA